MASVWEVATLMPTNPVPAKLAEAKYFLERMQEVREFHQQFAYNLSAFLSATYSVIDFLWSYYKPGRRTDFEEWWEELELPRDPVYRFFRKTRDVTLHRLPVPVRQEEIRYRVEKREGLDNEEHADLVEIRQGLYTVRVSATGPDAAESIAKEKLGGLLETTTYEWWFDDLWFDDLPEQLSHHNKVLELAAYYVDGVEQVVVQALERFGE